MERTLVPSEWLDRNIRRKAPLGAEYPRWEYLMEGDTPSLQQWHLLAETRPIWTDADDEVLGVDGHWHDDNHATIWRWREACPNDFAARMDWTIKSYAEANHPPTPKLGHPARLTAKPGQRVELSAEGTTAPDGDAVSYDWFYSNEAGTFPLSSARSGQPLGIHDFDQAKAWFTAPAGRVMAPGSGDTHTILAGTDHGTPRLTRYARMIIDVRS